MTSDNGQQQTATALKWLYEMEIVDNPVLKSNLYENVFMSDSGIQDCAVWIVPEFTHQKGILVWIKLKRWSKWFKKEEVLAKVKNVVKELLPSYEVRVTEDRNILKLAQDKIKEVYGEVEDEKSNTINNDDTDGNGNGLKSSGEGGVSLEEASNILPDSKEQAEDRPEVRDEVEQLDPQIDQKAQSVIDDIYSNSDAGVGLPPKR